MKERMATRTKLPRRTGRNDRGYSMLEYAAGAAIILGILYGAMTLLNQGVTELFGSISTWASNHAKDLKNKAPIGSTTP